MDPRVRDLWINALEGEAFEQCEGRLERVEDGKSSYCCLGVLSFLAVNEGVAGRSSKDDSCCESCHPDQDTVERVYYDGESTVLPTSVMTWAGLDDSNPTVTLTLDYLSKFDNVDYEALEPYRDGGDPRYVITLADLNDTGRFTFKQIAEIVRDHL